VARETNETREERRRIKKKKAVDVISTRRKARPTRRRRRERGEDGRGVARDEKKKKNQLDRNAKKKVVAFFEKVSPSLTTRLATAGDPRSREGLLKPRSRPTAVARASRRRTRACTASSAALFCRRL
jgi:hypothetical protein